MRKDKGITLVALVITMIIMLILIGVTITLSINGGLFTYAKEAGEGTQEAMNEEHGIAAGKIDYGGKATTTDAILGGSTFANEFAVILKTLTGDSFTENTIPKEVRYGETISGTIKIMGPSYTTNDRAIIKSIKMGGKELTKGEDYLVKQIADFEMEVTIKNVTGNLVIEFGKEEKQTVGGITRR